MKLGNLIPELASTYKQQAKAVWAAKKEAEKQEKNNLELHYRIRQAIEHVVPHLVYLQCSHCIMKPSCKLASHERNFNCRTFKY